MSRLRYSSWPPPGPTGLEPYRIPGVERPLVLAVDDQPIHLRILHEILGADYEVCIATGGAQALAFCETRIPDLILLDVMMPDMSGYEVCQQLKGKRATRDVPVIFVTAQNDPAEEARGLDEGAVDFVSKPLHEKVVRARVRTHLLLRYQAEALRALASTDGLTGVANRRQFDKSFERAWRHGQRTGEALSLLMIDVDYFKRYNDLYGHQNGDACLRAVATAIETTLRRPYDLVARYGGEEFACILPATGSEAARQRAMTVEQAVRGLGIPHDGAEAKIVTVSIGVATASRDPKALPELLLAAADRGLYAAKLAGRGRVEIAPES